MENVAGELTKSDLKKVLAGAGVKESGEMDFTTFKKVMLDLEDVLDDGEDDEEDDDSETALTSKEGASPVQSAGKGFARSEVGSSVAPASSSGQGEEEEDYSDEDEEELTDEEEEAIAQEIFDELKSKSGKVSVKNLMAYETVADLLKCMGRELFNYLHVVSFL